MQTYFEITRHRGLEELNDYLYEESESILEIVSLEENDEYINSLMLIVKKVK